MRRTLPQASHIARKARIYYYRRRLPGRPGAEVAVSLRTRSYPEAEHLAALLDAEFDEAHVDADQQTTEPTNNAQVPDLNAVLRGYLRQRLDRDRRERLERIAQPPIYTPPAATAELANAALARVQDVQSCIRAGLASSRPTPGAWMLADLLIHRHSLPKTCRAALAIGVTEANLIAWQAIERRLRGNEPIVFTELDPPPPDPRSASARAAASAAVATTTPEAAKPAASTLVEPFFARRATVSDATCQVMNQERGTLRRFLEVCGDRPVDRYGRGDIALFLDTLRKLPKHYGKSPRDRDRPLEVIIADADATGAARLLEKTVKRHATALSQFFKFAWNQSHISQSAMNELVSDHEFQIARNTREQRDAWLGEELTKLYGSPMWTGHGASRTQPGNTITRDSKFWLPLLALFEGGRLEEFADTYGRDLGNEDGTYFIDIRESEERRTGKRSANGRKAQGRRLKNSGATRRVPLHPELIRLGFPEYVRSIAPNPDDPLFPDIKPQGPDGKRGSRVTRWFVEYRRAIGVYRPGVGMHAFRHTAITRLSNAITSWQQKRHRDFMMGHGGQDTEGDKRSEGDTRYDKGASLKEMARTLARLKYPEIDLSHLYVEQPPTGDAAMRSQRHAGRSRPKPPPASRSEG